MTDPAAEPPNMQMLEEVEYLRTTALAIERSDITNALYWRLVHDGASDEMVTGWIEALRYAADHIELGAWPDGPPATEEEA